MRRSIFLSGVVLLLASFATAVRVHAFQSPQQELVKETREAAGEEDSTHQFTHSPSVRWISKLTGLSVENSYRLALGLNFAFIAVVFVWVAKKSLPAWSRSRTNFIQKAMEEARKASEDANLRLAEIESRLTRLGTEIAEMRAAAEKEGAAEEQKIKAAAEEDGRKIIAAAELEITAAAKNARRELTAYAADLAVSLARKQIHVDAATDQALVQDLGRQLSATKD